MVNPNVIPIAIINEIYSRLWNRKIYSSKFIIFLIQDDFIGLRKNITPPINAGIDSKIKPVE